ncbi:uncharacterized protein LOC106064574 isoform X3 [Biomphalaria glabrata]|uniref:Uncharacterized protein LOC106064574 isoform X3 n=1 Tax=Biomphalaria glabrata TaxID=6526 RepID=A0A9W3AS00_BIOGL|nr:uncharacterized protein LOC106064574 isoform X3 [Biomphalaria glabrata]XP_055889995.1 uncharacterized protein LOC106064574 isoform X3 [Biomphalaria glabrata]XP_055889996.1 uncharacterized protein LOC106064574 isoform X3 [Biomphalaria glabrata]
MLSNETITVDNCLPVASLSDSQCHNSVLFNCENIPSMLSEHQTHSKQLLYTADTAVFPISELEPKRISGIYVSDLDEVDEEALAYEDNFFVNNCFTDEKQPLEAKSRLMIELLSLSCQLTALLNLPKFSATET